MDQAGDVKAGPKVFAAAYAFQQSAEQALEFVQSGMLAGVWRGDGKYFMHGFKKVGMLAARFQLTCWAGHQPGKIES